MCVRRTHTHTHTSSCEANACTKDRPCVRRARKNSTMYRDSSLNASVTFRTGGTDEARQKKVKLHGVTALSVALAIGSPSQIHKIHPIAHNSNGNDAVCVSLYLFFHARFSSSPLKTCCSACERGRNVKMIHSFLCFLFFPHSGRTKKCVHCEFYDSIVSLEMASPFAVAMQHALAHFERTQILRSDNCECECVRT